jgi:pyruvate/2-oxoglutarate/acetoin dehydrogenase E1 component
MQYKDSEYYNRIKANFESLAKVDNVLFCGQQVKSEAFYNFLKNISLDKRMEFPIAEELQMSFCLGLSLEGYLPICIYQRMDFIPRAFDSLVNHLDIFSELSRGKFNPKVIIFTTIGSTKPLDVGLQHNKNLVKSLEASLRNIPVFYCKTCEEVDEAFGRAYKNKDSSIIVVEQDLFNE